MQSIYGLADCRRVLGVLAAALWLGAPVVRAEQATSFESPMDMSAGTPRDAQKAIVPCPAIQEPPAANSDDARQVTELEADRAYLVETSRPGMTMIRQRVELAIGRLHPEFVRRLAGAIRDAREGGLMSVGVISAYRPPAFGVGGFSDKFNSLHSYGLAVDLFGIGAPGSADAKHWYEIAAKHELVCPYGVESRNEWNHCQPTRIKMIVPNNLLRETISGDGPLNVDCMFEAGSALIQAGIAASPADSAPGNIAAAARSNHKVARWQGIANKRVSSLIDRPSWCKDVNRPRQDLCGTSGRAQLYRTSSLIKRDSHRR